MNDETKQQIESLYREYEALQHAMQTGVAFEIEGRGVKPAAADPKYLRVGVNTALADHGALIGLLVSKGVITELEYAKAIRDGMQREVDRYRQRIQEHLGGAAGVVLA